MAGTRVGRICGLIFLSVSVPVWGDGVKPWQPTSTETLVERFPAPPGTQRLVVTGGSFGAWLRTLPVEPEGSPVLLFDGRRKRRQDVHAGVIDLDVGSQDLQQCADAVMRLRAEYLWSTACASDIAFNFTSGDRASWAEWSRGTRPKIEGSRVRWSRNADPDGSYRQFRNYLRTVFTYAGSHSLSRELRSVDDPRDVRPGDVFIQGGFPGHAVIVLDVAEDQSGARRFLLAQSYMPAQSLHVLKNPSDSESPWYAARRQGTLRTPEWTFDFGDLKRFERASCEPAD